MAVCIERAGALSCSRTCYLCTHPMSAASHLSEHTRCHMTANSALLYFFLGDRSQKHHKHSLASGAEGLMQHRQSQPAFQTHGKKRGISHSNMHLYAAQEVVIGEDNDVLQSGAVPGAPHIVCRKARAQVSSYLDRCKNQWVWRRLSLCKRPCYKACHS